MTEAALQGHDILCFSSIDWDFIWQGHLEIMSTLADHGNRVLFVENTEVRTPALRNLGRVLHRIRNWWNGSRSPGIPRLQAKERLGIPPPSRLVEAP